MKKDNLYLLWSIFSLLSTIFVWAPLHLYLNNITEFSDMRLCWLGILLSIILLALLIWQGLNYFFRKSEPKWVSIAFVISTALVWLRFYFLNDITALFDGNTEMRIIHSSYKLIFFVVILLIGVFCLKKWFSLVKPTAIILILIQIGSLLSLAYEKKAGFISTEYVADQAQWETFSTKENYLFIVLDTFRSDLFAELAQDKDFNQQLSGFIYYPNAVCGYTYTENNISLLLSNQYYQNDKPMLLFREETDNISLPQELQKNGINTDIFTVYPDRMQLYGSHWSNYLKRDASFDFKDAQYVYMIFALKVLPDFLVTKYNLHEKLLNDIFYKRQILDKEIAKMQIKVNDGDKRFKFMHLLSVHPPLNMNEAGEKESLGNDRDAFIRRGRKSFTDIIHLFNQLKEKGIYDNTMIVVLADHGSDHIPAGAVTFPINTSATNDMRQYVREGVPLVLIKPIQGQGILRIDNAPVHSIDLPKTIAEVAGLENHFTGYNILAPSTIPSNRVRTYFHINSTSDRTWQKGYVSALVEYQVNGFSWDEASWSRSGRILAEPK